MSRAEAFRILGSGADSAELVGAARRLALVPTDMLSAWFAEAAFCAQIAAASSVDDAERLLVERYWTETPWW